MVTNLRRLKMTKLSKDKMKEICQDVLTNVLTTAANNLVIEAAICVNSTDLNIDTKTDKLKKLYNCFKDLFIKSVSIDELQQRKIKELDTYIKAINGELHRARSQAMIYIDTLVIDTETK
jgi:endonuclease III